MNKQNKTNAASTILIYFFVGFSEREESLLFETFSKPQIQQLDSKNPYKLGFIWVKRW